MGGLREHPRTAARRRGARRRTRARRTGRGGRRPRGASSRARGAGSPWPPRPRARRARPPRCRSPARARLRGCRYGTRRALFVSCCMWIRPRLAVVQGAGVPAPVEPVPAVRCGALPKVTGAFPKWVNGLGDGAVARAGGPIVAGGGPARRGRRGSVEGGGGVEHWRSRREEEMRQRWHARSSWWPAAGGCTAALRRLMREGRAHGAAGVGCTVRLQGTQAHSASMTAARGDRK